MSLISNVSESLIMTTNPCCFSSEKKRFFFGMWETRVINEYKVGTFPVGPALYEFLTCISYIMYVTNHFLDFVVDLTVKVISYVQRIRPNTLYTQYLVGLTKN